jgi:hypothetical protein
MKVVTSLPATLDECSGMATLGKDLFVAHNDGGNSASLYVFSTKSKKDTRVVKIQGASNEDWEELASDDEYIYIADTGNNSGTRKDLVVYRVKKDDVLHEKEADAAEIEFYYPEQDHFKSSHHHNFDCEAMICVGDSLYLFTKNRGDGKTDAYSIPNTPGKYAARHVGQFDAGGLVTGADFRITGSQGELVLIGYQNEDHGYHPFLLYFQDVTGTDFFQGLPHRMDFSGTLQTETILFHDMQHVLISNEETKTDPGLLYLVDLKKLE